MLKSVNLLLSGMAILQSDVTGSRIRLDSRLDCLLHACSRKSDKPCISEWLFQWNVRTDLYFMAFSLEKSYSRIRFGAKSKSKRVSFSGNLTMIRNWNLIVHVKEIYTTAAIWCTVFEAQLGWNDSTDWKSDQWKSKKNKSQEYFQTVTF